MNTKKTKLPGCNQEASEGMLTMGLESKYTPTALIRNSANYETGRIVGAGIVKQVEPWPHLLPERPIVASGPLAAAALKLPKGAIASLSRAELVLALSILAIAWENSSSTFDGWVQVGETRLLRFCALSRSTFYNAKRRLVNRGLLKVHKANYVCEYRVVFESVRELEPRERASAYLAFGGPDGE